MQVNNVMYWSGVVVLLAAMIQRVESCGLMKVLMDNRWKKRQKSLTDTEILTIGIFLFHPREGGLVLLVFTFQSKV